MDAQTTFPKEIIAVGMAVPEVKLDGQKVLFDKKVSLLPIELKKDEPRAKRKPGY